MPPKSHYPSLMLVANGYEADWYSVDADNLIKKIESIREEKTTYSDNEGGFGRNKVGAPDIINSDKEARLKKYIQMISEKTKGFWNGKEYKHLTICIPERYKNKVSKEMKSKVGAKSIKYQFGNFTYEGKQRLLDLFKKSLKIYKE